MYQERVYRQLHQSDLHSFQVKYEACDLWLAVSKASYSNALQEYCYSFIKQQWCELYSYITTDSLFAETLAPHTPLPVAPVIAQRMAQSATLANVGPMAAVAGCFAQALGRQLQTTFQVPELIIENGGDIWLSSLQQRTIALHAGQSPLSGKIGLQIPPSASLGICTSSGTVGHSLSFGRADAVTVLATDAACADAFATSIANRINQPADIQYELDNLHPDLLGCVIILGEHIGAKGGFQLTTI